MEWRRVPLEQVLLEAGSGTWGSEPDGSKPSYPVLRSTNIRDGRLILDEPALRTVSVKTAQKYELRDGDILVTTSSGSRHLIGKNALVGQLQGRFLFSNFTWRLRPESDRIVPRFLFYYLNSTTARAELDRIQSTTSGLRNLNTKLYLVQPVPLPPLSEQRRIVEILDQADHLRRLRTEANTKANRILPALFLKMFGDPATNPMGWPVRTLGELANFGPQYGANARSAPLLDGQPRYVRITDVQEGGALSADAVGIDLDDWEPYRLQEGDLLFARSGATVGKAYIHREHRRPCVFAGYLIRFRLDEDKLHPLVAFAFTQTPAYRSWVESKRRTAAQPNINGQEYSSLAVPVPDREVQEQFVAFLARSTGTRDRMESSSSGLVQLFSTLLHRALSSALTLRWREAHRKQLAKEIEHQAKSFSEA